MTINSADNVAELLDRSGNSVPMNDLRQAKSIELLTGFGGKVWVNVDGVCLLRIQLCDVVIVDTTNALRTEKAPELEAGPEADHDQAQID